MYGHLLLIAQTIAVRCLTSTPTTTATTSHITFDKIIKHQPQQPTVSSSNSKPTNHPFLTLTSPTHQITRYPLLNRNKFTTKRVLRVTLIVAVNPNPHISRFHIHTLIAPIHQFITTISSRNRYIVITRRRCILSGTTSRNSANH